MTNKLSVEEQLKRTEKEVDDLRHALDHSSIVAITDAQGKITYVNDKFCEISKYSREELIGNNHRIINSRFHSKEFFIALWKTISSGKVWKGEIKNQAKDGSFYWVFTTIVPFVSPQGQLFQYVAIRTDITEQKLTQERAEQQRLALLHAEKMASVGEMAAGIGHELGNPLAALSGRIEFLEMKIQAGNFNKEDVLSTIATVKTLTDRMASIIRGMRALSRDGTNDPFQKVSLGGLVNDILEFTWDGFKKHGIKVHFDIPKDPVMIHCQPTQISQVFVNLINNAKDAVVELNEKWIKVEILDHESYVDVAVTDSGAGIPEGLREKIMAPFFTTKEMGKGSGLGLSVSKTIVEHHRGTLRIDSKSSHTRFVVRLPKQIDGV